MTGKIYGALDRCRGFIKNLVAGERCNITVENFEGSRSKQKVALGYQTFAGKFCIAGEEFSDQSPMPYEHPRGSRLWEVVAHGGSTVSNYNTYS